MPCNRLNSLNTLSIGTRISLGLLSRRSSKSSCKDCHFKSIRIQKLSKRIKSLEYYSKYLNNYARLLEHRLLDQDNYIRSLQDNCECYMRSSYYDSDCYSDASYSSPGNSSVPVVDTVPADSVSGPLILFNASDPSSLFLRLSSDSIIFSSVDSHVVDNSSTVESSTIHIDSFVPPESFHAITYPEQ